jgi:hypothetical protein
MTPPEGAYPRTVRGVHQAVRQRGSVPRQARLPVERRCRVSDQAARQERHTEPITIALDHLLAQDRFEQPYVRAANVALDALLAERDALAAQLEQTREALRDEVQKRHFARRQRLGWDTWGNEALEHFALEAF